MLSNYSQILKFLGQRVDKQLKFDFDTTKYYMAKLENGVTYETIGALTRLLEIDFICHDPAAYDTTEENETDVALVITAAAGGTSTAYPEFTINTPGATVTITHDLSGNVLTWSGSATGLTITTEPGNKLIVDGATPVMENVSGGWPFLVASVTNTFTITGAASASITWRPRYID
jgi:phage-related protein